MLPDDLIFGDQAYCFNIESVEYQSDATLTLIVHSRQKEVLCPECGSHSSRIHSYYYRQVKDLPVFGKGVIMKLKSRKFYCDNDVCCRKIFVERFPIHFSLYQRVTDRLREKLLKVALLMGGNPGAVLCQTLNIETSSSSLIRYIHKEKTNQPLSPTHIGIDDWAYKKGHTYGTAIVDLKKRSVIDLLPDRESCSVEKWLADHPGIKVVTRDRFSNYSKGVSMGAPTCKQVADRWHLLKNLGDAVKKLLERKRQELRRAEVARISKRQKKNPAETTFILEAKESPSKRMAQMQEIKKLIASGVGIRTIAQTIGMSRNTVRKYIHLDEPPNKKRPGSEILKYADYFKRRIQEVPNIETIQLWREIKNKGYKGSRSVVYEFLKMYTRSKNKAPIQYIPQQSWTPSKVSLLLYRDEDELSMGDRQLIHKLKKKSPDIEIAHQLVQRFKLLMLKKSGNLLKGWINQAMKCPIHELRAFSKGLLTDFKAIKNAFSLKWSNGPVEGQINKLKTIKRQMYGRAGFSLLRKRIILSCNHQN